MNGNSSYSASFYLASIGSNFVSSLAVQALIGRESGTWSGKMILSLSYAGGRLIYNLGVSNVDALKDNCGQAKGLVGFVLEVGLTSVFFWGIAYLIGYGISLWYAALLGLASAPLSDRLDSAIKSSMT